MWRLKRELQDLSYVFLDAENSSRIAGKRSKIVEQSKKIIEEEILPNLQAHLGESAQIIAEWRGIYEIYERLKKRNISLEDLSPTDIWRINIVAPVDPDGNYCHIHMVEGKIQQMYSPDVRENYIGINARPNGHEFLHSYVKVSDFGLLLIQIRDQKMQRNYKYGILSRAQKDKDFKWLLALIEDLKSEGVNEDTLYERIAAKTDPIDVYNRYGDKVAGLPFGSTALDFACTIKDPEVFIRAESATIFRRGQGDPFPLWEVLQPNDSVVIKTEKAVRPTLKWMDWMRTDAALERLQEYFKANPNGSAQEFLNEKSMEYHLPAQELLKNTFFLSFIEKKGFSSSDDFLSKIGRAEIDVEELLEEFMAVYNEMVRSGNKKLIGFRIEGEERVGLLNDITMRLREQGINLAAGDFYKVREKRSEKRREKAVIALIVETVTGEAGEVTKLQVETIVEQTSEIEQFKALTQKETRKLHRTIRRKR
jgi:(p)ppGpp synthase/HD superfamily hydrolase